MISDRCGVSYTFDEAEAKKDRLNTVPFNYKLHHIPSKKTMDRVLYTDTKAGLLALLNSWNQQGETWKYWTEEI